MIITPALPTSCGEVRLKVLLAVILLIIVAILTPIIVFHALSAKAIHRLKATVRQKGEPLTLPELAANYPSVPEDENAAMALLRIWEKEDPTFWQAYISGQQKLPMRAERPVPSELPFLGHDIRHLSRTDYLSPTSRKAAEDYLREHISHLEAVRAALRRPHCVFPVTMTNVTDPNAVLLPYDAEVKMEALNFRVTAALALDHGDIESTISALEDIQRTGQCLAECPLLLDQLVRVACLSMMLEDAQRLLSQHALSTTQLDRLENGIERATMPRAWHTSLVSERACISSAFDHPMESSELLGGQQNSDERAGGASSRYGVRLLSVSGLAAADHRFMLETMAQAIALADENTADSLQRYQQLFVHVGQDIFRFPPKIFSGIMLPALAKAGNKFVGYEARRRAALVAIAIERYRLSHDEHLPSHLDALAPGIPPQVLTDPFVEQPLRFHALPTGFVVYSVGADRHDDGGKERPEKGPLTNYDETFVVER
jgi:hypothetical protein